MKCKKIIIILGFCFFLVSCDNYYHYSDLKPNSTNVYLIEHEISNLCPELPRDYFRIIWVEMPIFKKYEIYLLASKCNDCLPEIFCAIDKFGETSCNYYNHFMTLKEDCKCKNVPDMQTDEWEHARIELSKLFKIENTNVTEENLEDYLKVIALFYYGRTKILFNAKDVDQIRQKLPNEYKWMTKQKYLIDNNDKKKILFITYGFFYQRGSVVEMTIKNNGEILSYKSTQFSMESE